MTILRRIRVVGPSLEPQVVTDVRSIQTWETISVGERRQSLQSSCGDSQAQNRFQPVSFGYRRDGP
jgi:hypothetical protein